MALDPLSPGSSLSASSNTHTQRRGNATVLYLSVLLTGSCGLAYEYTLSKVASDLLGNSTRQWALIIGVMMFFMGLGANYQKLFRRRDLFSLFVMLEALLSLLGGFSPLVLLFAYTGWHSHYILIQYALIAAIGFLIGLEIPIITRINQRFTPELKVNLGRTLQMDYVGALGGAVLWSFLLLPKLSVSRSALVLGFSNIAVTWLFLLYFRQQLPNQRWFRWLLLLCGFSSGMLVLGFVYSPRWSFYAEQGLYRDRIIFRKTSAYQHFVLTQSTKARSPYYSDLDAANSTAEPEYRLYINGHIQFSSLDEFIYHENLVHPAMVLAAIHRPVRRVLILGGGDGLALREVLKYKSVREAVLVDLDAEILRFAKEHPIMRHLNKDALRDGRITSLLLPKGSAVSSLVQPVIKRHQLDEGRSSPQVILHSLDAMEYIKRAPGFFDVIIADFPDPSNESLSKLYSLSFYHGIKQHLSKGGVFVQQSTSSVYAYKAFLAIGRSMQAAGLDVQPYHDTVPSFGEWGWWLARKPSEVTLAHDFLSIKLGPVPLRYLNEQLIQANISFPDSFAQLWKQKNLNANANTMELADAKFFRKWVGTLSEPKVFQYYQQSAW